jgi:hypothetical protein
MINPLPSPPRLPSHSLMTDQTRSNFQHSLKNPPSTTHLSKKIGLHRRIRKVIINNPRPTEIGALIINQNPRRIHKIRIPGDIGLLIHPRHDLLQEALQLRLRVGILIREPKLCDPDRTAPCNGARLIDEVFEVGGAGVFVGVPVHVDEVDGAAGAVAHEPREVGEAVGRAAVGDGGGAEECLARERLHVLLVGADGGVDGHAGGALDAEIGLVEGHEGRRAGVDGGLGGARPGVEETLRVAVKEGDVANSRVEAAGGLARGARLVEPIVGPGDAGVLAR